MLNRRDHYINIVVIYNTICGLFRHPDKNKDPKAEDMFIKISKSYEVGKRSSLASFTLFLGVEWSDISYTPLTFPFFHFSDFVQRRAKVQLRSLRADGWKPAFWPVASSRFPQLSQQFLLWWVIFPFSQVNFTVFFIMSQSILFIINMFLFKKSTSRY